MANSDLLKPGRVPGDAPSVVLGGHFPWLKDTTPPLGIVLDRPATSAGRHRTDVRAERVHHDNRNGLRVGNGDHCQTAGCSRRAAFRGSDYCEPCLEERDGT